MAVTTVVRRMTLTGAATVSWPVAMPIMRVQDIRCWIVDTSVSPNTVTLLTRDVDFTVTLVSTKLPSAFTLALLAGPYPGGLPANRELRVVRDTQMTQAETFLQGDPFPESAVETVLDKAALLSQDADDKVRRAVRANDADPESTDLELPVASDRAGKYAIYDGDGDPGVAGAPAGTTTASAWGANWIVHANDAAALADLGIDHDVKSGTAAARPAAAVFGVGFYYATDTYSLSYSDGVNWIGVGLEQFAQASLPAPSLAGRTLLDSTRYQGWYDDGAALQPIRQFPPGFIHRLYVERESTTRVYIGPGSCRDETDVTNLQTTSGFYKLINGAGNWAAGSGFVNGFPAGALAVADTWYRVFIIGKDDGSTDFGFDTDVAAVNLLADSGYDYYRRIGWARTNASVQWDLWEYDYSNEWTWWQTPMECYRDTIDQDYGSSWGVRLLAYVPRYCECILNVAFQALAGEVGIIMNGDCRVTVAPGVFNATGNPIGNISAATPAQIHTSTNGARAIMIRVTSDAADKIKIDALAWRDNRSTP